MRRERSLRLSPTCRLTVSTGLALSAFALGAMPALADTTPAPTAPSAPAAPVVVAPQTANVSQIVAAAATAVQTGPQNINLSIRVASPGDNGAVSQTVAAIAGAAAGA